MSVPVALPLDSRAWHGDLPPTATLQGVQVQPVPDPGWGGHDCLRASYLQGMHKSGVREWHLPAVNLPGGSRAPRQVGLCTKVFMCNMCDYVYWVTLNWSHMTVCYSYTNVLTCLYVTYRIKGHIRCWGCSLSKQHKHIMVSRKSLGRAFCEYMEQSSGTQRESMSIIAEGGGHGGRAVRNEASAGHPWRSCCSVGGKNWTLEQNQWASTTSCPLGLTNKKTNRMQKQQCQSVCGPDDPALCGLCGEQTWSLHSTCLVAWNCLGLDLAKWNLFKMTVPKGFRKRSEPGQQLSGIHSEALSETFTVRHSLRSWERYPPGSQRDHRKDIPAAANGITGDRSPPAANGIIRVISPWQPIGSWVRYLPPGSQLDHGREISSASSGIMGGTSSSSQLDYGRETPPPQPMESWESMHRCRQNGQLERVGIVLLVENNR